MMNEQQFDLNTPNIFMRVFFNDHTSDQETTITFIYSDTNGFKHLRKQLNDSDLFNGLFNEKEVFKKMSDKLANAFSYNTNLSLYSSEWNGVLIINYSTQGNNLVDEFKKWKIQLEKLVGKENLFQVTIPEVEFDNFRSTVDEKTPGNIRDQAIFNYIESYRLQLELKSDLSINKKNENKVKI